MKKVKTTLWLAAVLAGVAGTTFWSLASTSEKLEATPLKQEKVMKRAEISKIPSADMPYNYWAEAKSCYNNGKFDMDNGEARQFPVHVTIDGDKATIYGLVDLNYDEVDKEFAIEGTYDDRNGKITVSVESYDSEKPVTSYTKIANMYSETSQKNYVLVLFAGDMDADSGSLTTTDELVFTVSDDLSTLTSKTGYGVYAFDTQGNAMAFYDYYQKGVTFTKATADGAVEVSTTELNFSDQVVTAGNPIKSRIYLYNKSTEATNFTITSTSEQLTANVTEGTLSACSYQAIDITLNCPEPGVFDGSLSISGDKISPAITLNVNTEVYDADYTKITKEGSEAFDILPTSPYPFVISEYEGHIAGHSTNYAKGDNTESGIVCKVNVPTGKTGVFNWGAVHMNQQPNSLFVLLDDEWYKWDMYGTNASPRSMSGTMALTEGEHTIVFVNSVSMDWSIYGTNSEAYVWDLDLQFVETKADNAYLADNNVDFGKTYYDNLSVDMPSTVKILNVGSNPLKITEVVADGNFKGEVPAISVPTGGEIEVPLTWVASAVGTDSGNPVIKTTGGEFTLNCTGEALSLPYDYKTLVSEGEFSFNTDMAWPFIFSDNGKYVYNSTSKQDIDGITYSWLDAQFEVPEGKVGVLDWDATNSSEELFWFMNTPSLISGTIFTIDGGNEQYAAGEDFECPASVMYPSNVLTFKSGRHALKMNYKKTDNREGYVFGDDRLKLFELCLKLFNVEDYQSSISTDAVTYDKNVLVGCAGHQVVDIYNFTTKTPEILSQECDGPFEAKVLRIADNGDLNLMIEFVPTEGGEYNNDLKICTNIGDFTINCSGKGVDTSLGNALYYESFEYGYQDWDIIDGNDDENTWTGVSKNPSLIDRGYSSKYEGNESLVIVGYDPNTFTYYDVDDYAVTPQIAIPADGKTTLRFMLSNFSYMQQDLEIMVGEGDDPTEYTVAETISCKSKTDWEIKTVDLSEYAGKTVRIAFHGTLNIYFAMTIDDVLVASTGTSAVKDICGEVMIVAREYYTTDGVRVATPAKGLYIVVSRMSDGTIVTEKKMVK
ncbi:MAG: choice-of-anchor J domain-containing protein [Lepagella sp.]